MTMRGPKICPPVDPDEFKAAATAIAQQTVLHQKVMSFYRLALAAFELPPLPGCSEEMSLDLRLSHMAYEYHPLRAHPKDEADWALEKERYNEALRNGDR